MKSQSKKRLLSSGQAHKTGRQQEYMTKDDSSKPSTKAQIGHRHHDFTGTSSRCGGLLIIMNSLQPFILILPSTCRYFNTPGHYVKCQAGKYLSSAIFRPQRIKLMLDWHLPLFLYLITDLMGEYSIPQEVGGGPRTCGEV
eukprot:scaffold2415_cov73-Skeletonema_menzelii.AAC.1